MAASRRSRGAAEGTRMGLEFAENPRVGQQVADSPRVVAVMTTVALMVEREARKRAPVDTGRLRNSISHRVSRSGSQVVAEVGTNVAYAGFQEFGTRHMRGKRYLGTALRTVAEQLAARGRR